MTESIKLDPMEKTILQIAVQRQISELEKVSKKASKLGVEITDALNKDINVLRDLETKLL